MELNGVVMRRAEGSPLNGVWDKSWLPVFAGDGGYFLITSSSRRESTSAIWFNDREEPETTLAYDSLAALIATVTECYETNAYSLDAGAAIRENAAKVGEVFRKHNPQAAGLPAVVIESDASFVGLLDTLVHSDGWAKGEAANNLMKRKDRNAVPAPMELLTDTNAVVRGLAARILEQTKDDRAVPALIESLKYLDLNARKYAAMALAAIGDRRVIIPLIEVLRVLECLADTSWEVRIVHIPAVQMRVQRFLRDHRDHITIRRLRNNEPVTQKDMAALQNILFSEDGPVPREEYEQLFGDRPLWVLVRSVVGLDRNAAKSIVAAILDETLPSEVTLFELAAGTPLL